MSPTNHLKTSCKVYLFLDMAVRDFIRELKEEDFEHHLWLIGRPAKIWSISILAKLVHEGKIDSFIEVNLGDHPRVDMAT